MAVLTNIKRLVLMVVVVTVAMAVCFSATARSTADIHAQKIEAGLVYNFLKYTAWPKSSLSGNMVVCLFGEDSFDGNLDPLEGRTAQQHAITIRRIDRVELLDACHLVFIPRSRGADLQNILARTVGKAILTVSNIPNFAAQGGMSAGLRIQDRMVNLAEVVQK